MSRGGSSCCRLTVKVVCHARGGHAKSKRAKTGFGSLMAAGDHAPRSVQSTSCAASCSDGAEGYVSISQKEAEAGLRRKIAVTAATEETALVSSQDASTVLGELISKLPLSPCHYNLFGAVALVWVVAGVIEAMRPWAIADAKRAYGLDALGMGVLVCCL